jgi:hypothetical protein
MKFNYDLSGHGWANGFIEMNSKRFEFSPSYVTDAFGDLLRSLVSLLTHEEELETLIWDEEPRGVEWTFVRKNNDTLSIKITIYEEVEDAYDRSKQKGEALIDIDCLFIDFIKEVVREADQLLITNGILGYRNLLGMHEFPLSSYLQLKDFLKSKEIITIDEKSNLREELHILHALVEE